jgi:very-short-patch-repair endonuclease
VFSLVQIIFFVIGCLASLSLLVLLFPNWFCKKKRFYSRPVITQFERKMFVRLKSAFPEHHVLAQVAFSALITHHNMKIRNLFNRKVTDFVILNQSFNVIAIVELDDPSHLGREAEDAKRDDMLEEAGYRVFRYTDIPSTHVLRKEIL